MSIPTAFIQIESTKANVTHLTLLDCDLKFDSQL